MFCPHCGNAADESASICSCCGVELRDGPALPAHGTGPLPDVRMLYAAVLGPNRNYYLHYFSRCDRAGKAGPSWHWPAFLVTLLWLIYRKMWLNAFLYYALVYWLLPNLLRITIGIARAMETDSSRVAAGGAYLTAVLICAAEMAAMWLAPAICANALYYRHCRKKIFQATASDTQVQLDELAAEGGVGPVPLAIIAAPVTIAVVGTLAAIMLPLVIQQNQ